jgi:hypothetical protein
VGVTLFVGEGWGGEDNGEGVGGSVFEVWEVVSGGGERWVKG